MARINIKQIAQKAGVSIAAVSYVINGKPGVSKHTRERIHEIIEQENYIPNVNSRRLVLKRSFNIYLVIDNDSSLDNMFYSSLLSAIVSQSAVYGYNIVLSNMAEGFTKSSVAIEARQGNVDGLIFLHDIDFETLKAIQIEKIPFVIIDSHLSEPKYPSVRVDYELATYTVTRYLIEQNHTDIGFVAMNRIPDFYAATLNGLLRAFAEENLILRPAWLQSNAFDMKSAFHCMENILAAKEKPTAIVCTGDIFALACMNCAQSLGYYVPKDISFISIDDLYISHIYYPSLTTLHIDPIDMAGKAVLLLNYQFSGNLPDANLSYKLCSDKLVIRSSVSRRA